MIDPICVCRRWECCGEPARAGTAVGLRRGLPSSAATSRARGSSSAGESQDAHLRRRARLKHQQQPLPGESITLHGDTTLPFHRQTSPAPAPTPSSSSELHGRRVSPVWCRGVYPRHPAAPVPAAGRDGGCGGCTHSSFEISLLQVRAYHLWETSDKMHVRAL